jgi:hypothetical protein
VIKPAELFIYITAFAGAAFYLGVATMFFWSVILSVSKTSPLHALIFSPLVAVMSLGWILFYAWYEIQSELTWRGIRRKRNK